ncbi:MAG TPA: aminoacyl-tRNA hydrolase [Phycisphaerae bacterium]|nr:aminoacyl-tRNA hydrolase [Phycisphaerae bacterium]
MKLITGLGNPGSQYERTRHNAGFMAVDLFAQKHGAANFRVAHESFMADVLLPGEKILLLKPQTYMNLSGRAVASAMAFYKLAIDDLLVVVDDIALPVGTIRLRASGSAGGHNGLRDIERALANLAAAAGKTGQDYQRLRIGVDSPGRVPQKDYVLTAFTPEQKPRLEASLKSAAEAMELWATSGITPAMNKFNAGDNEKP